VKVLVMPGGRVQVMTWPARVKILRVAKRFFTFPGTNARTEASHQHETMLRTSDTGRRRARAERHPDQPLGRILWCRSVVLWGEHPSARARAFSRKHGLPSAALARGWAVLSISKT
jgi:hypothetical protein